MTYEGKRMHGLVGPNLTTIAKSIPTSWQRVHNREEWVNDNGERVIRLLDKHGVRALQTGREIISSESCLYAIGREKMAWDSSASVAIREAEKCSIPIVDLDGYSEED